MSAGTRTELGRADERLEAIWDTRPGLWGWLGAVNHKQVGKRFIATAFVFFLIGGIQALLLRIQLGTPESTFLDPQTYNELFTMHGTTMMFLFAVPITEAVAIYFAPLMIGARDMPFPRLNAFGYWAYLCGGLLLYSSFAFGAVPDGGWYAYVPLTNREFAPGANMDFWLLGVTFVEISGTIAAIEIIVLVMKFRAPGMSIARMPLFVWSVFVTSVMVMFAFPPLIVGSLMLELDRKLGTHFYNPDLGGDPLLWQHLFWWFGHPEVYIILLPAVGIISTVVPVFARTRIVGYTLIATSTVAIAIISFGVWVHHMFTTGIPFVGLGFFAAGSLAITIPSGVQIFAWLATLWKGQPRWDPPLLWVVGFLVTFVFGGLSGVMFAVVPFNWQAHDTYFVVAHFHYVLIGGVVFPMFAGFAFWWPKVTGWMLDRRLSVASFWTTMVGVNLLFLPQHVVGLLGMTRRIYTWPAGIGWEPYNLLSTLGAFLSAVGVAIFVADLAWSAVRRVPAGDDPWGAATLEWATTSPPRGYNFALVPTVSSRDPLWDPEQVAGTGGEQEVEPWRRPLSDPERPRREMVVTTVLDAEPEEVVTLPFHSLWPLWSALSIAVALIGALTDRTAILLLGAAVLVVSLIGWLWSRQDEPIA